MNRDDEYVMSKIDERIAQIARDLEKGWELCDLFRDPRVRAEAEYKLLNIAGEIAERRSRSASNDDS